MMVTFLYTRNSPGFVISQFPPPSAAKSTITDPGIMLSTISFVIKTGDFLPGIAAVVMIIFTSFACSANKLISASMNSLLIVLA